MKKLLCILAASFMLLMHNPIATAEDISLFDGSNEANTSPPNVLLVIDNAANFSSSTTFTCPVSALASSNLANTVGGIEQCALYSALSGLKNGVVNIGIMVYNGPNVVDFQGKACNSSQQGGCLVYPMTLLDSTSKTALLNWIANWTTTASKTGSTPGYIKASGESTASTMQEAWAYYQGKTGISKTNYSGIAPVKNVCGNDYVIFIGNSYSASGSPSDSSNNPSPQDALNGYASVSAMNANPAATTTQKTVYTPTITTTCSKPSATVTLGATNHNNNGYYLDEWARYMNQQASLTTYTIGVLGDSCQSNYAALLSSTAELGGGKYFPTTDLSQLEIALNSVLSEVLAVNSVFASVSLPVTANTSGTYLNQVFIGMFRPDGHGLPRWQGNLKQFKIGYPPGSSTPDLVDAAGNSAISSTNTGFIDACARSFWYGSSPPDTPDPYSPGGNFFVDSYWSFNPEGNCLAPSGAASDYYLNSNFPDGDIVEKGAQGNALRMISPSSRTVYSCSATTNGTTSVSTSGCLTASPSKTFFSSATLPLASGSTESTGTLMNWAIGEDVQQEDINNPAPTGTTTLSSTAMRPSVHGGVIHSQPVAIDYGTNGSPQVVVYYGADDGMLRAINGDQDGGNTVGGADPGQELWSFVAPESYNLFDNLYNNNTSVYMPTIPTGKPKMYGMDGPITSYRTYNASKTQLTSAWIFAGMRRGGRALYAFDVSNPGNPSPKWEIGCPSNLPYYTASGSVKATNSSGQSIISIDNSDCTSGFIGLGQTWSAAVPLEASGYTGPLLIMGGGYDTCEDVDPNSCTSATQQGNHIYVIDADKGSTLATLDTTRDVVGDVVVVPDSSGNAQWAYATDMGGNVYRISGSDANTPIGSTAPDKWTKTKIASLGCDTLPATCAANRKFMFGPDVVDNGDGTYSLMIGSGDREKPLSSTYFPSANSVQNYFFEVIDNPTSTTWLTSENTQNGKCGADVICLNSLGLLSLNSSGAVSGSATSKGWALPLAATEQVVTSSVTVYGTTTFSTHFPPGTDTSLCTANLGTSYVYNVNYTNGQPAFPSTSAYQEIAGGGLPAPPVAGQVEVNGQTVPFVFGSKPNSPLSPGMPPPPPSANLPKRRVYWYIQQ